MATIGTFHKDDAGHINGHIRTLNWNIEQATFRSVEKDSEKAPDYRLFTGGCELGAAWKRTTREGADYLSVKLDDPTLESPVYAMLMDADEGYRLIWSRPDKAKSKAAA